MIFKYQRILFICISLFLLTSSCEDKKKNSFGEITLSFNYGGLLEEDLNIKENTVDTKLDKIKINNSIFKNQAGLSKEKEQFKSDNLKKNTIDAHILDDELDKNLMNEIMFDYRYAGIRINNGNQQIIDLTTTTSFSQTVPIGTAVVDVELLNSTNLAIYRSTKNINVLEDQPNAVNFVASDWAIINQEIEIINNFVDTYTLGENIEIGWTNTHTRRGVRLQLIEESSENVIKTIISDYNADLFEFDTSSEEVSQNIGFKVVSMIGTGSDFFCCFDLVTQNQSPTANNVSKTMNEDDTVEIEFAGNDEDGDSLTYTIASNPSFGTLGSINGNVVVYTPNQDYFGNDSFRYIASDGTDSSDDAQVSIIINPVNDAPTTSDVTTQIDENLSQAINIIVGITLQGSDVDGDDLTYSIVSQPSNGGLSDISNNTVVYTANQDWNGTDTFTFKANDGTLDSNISTVTVTVDAVNDAPTTSDVVTSTNEDAAIDIDLVGSDIDTGDTITFSIVSDVSNGSTNVSGSTVTYTPNADWYGTETFTYKANDGTLDSNISTVTVTVDAVNDAPTTDGGKTYSTPYDTPLEVILSGEDVDGDNLTYNITESSTSGSATIEISDNIATITPTTTNSVNTKISFKYQVSDGNLNSEETTVAIWLIGNEFTNPTSSSEWMVGTTETIAWTRGPDFDTSSGLFLVKDGDYENRITIVNPIPTQGSNLVNSYDYVIPNDLELSNDYQVLIAQATNDFPDGQYHYSKTFAISASTTTKSYTLDSSDSVSGKSFYEYTINVPDQGRLLDADFTISLNGNEYNHLRYMNLLLISPNKSRILLAGGDQQSVECSPTGGCISASANTFTNTTFNDEASTNIHAGSPPFIGSFLPNQPLSTFDDEEINGDWTFVVINHASASVNPPDLELTLTYDPNLGGSTYQEENNFIFSPSDQSLFTVAGNSTGVITIPVSLTGNQTISDLDFELSLDGNEYNHLRYLSVTVDIGNSNNAKLVFRGDQISGSGNAYSRSQASIYKARFDDEASLDYSASLMFNQRVHTIENNALASFDGQSLNEFRIYVFNSASASLTIDRAKTKLFLDVSSSTGNNAPVTNDVSSKGYVEDGSLDIALDGSDEDGNSLTYSIVSNPSNGTVSINNNIATYTPVNFSGADSFTYKANDGTDDSNISTVNVGMYDIGKTSLYFNRDLSNGIERSFLEIPQQNVVGSIDWTYKYAFQISMWIKPETQLYNTSYLYSVFADVNNNFGIKLTNNGDLFFEAVRNGTYYIDEDFNSNFNIPMDGNTWTHIVIRVLQNDDNVCYIEGFKNGVEVGSGSAGWSAKYIFRDLGSLNAVIGTQRKNISNDTQYIGYIDELLFVGQGGNYTRGAFLDSHISELYNDGHNLINPRGYFGTAYQFNYDWNLNEGSGLPLDEINNSSAIDIDGATWVTE